MNRTHKKCIVGSVCLHGLLLGVVAFGAAFFSGESKQTVTVLTLLPSNVPITDDPTRGGGTPARSQPAQPAPAAVQSAPPATQPARPEPAPPPELPPSKPQVKEPEPEPPKPAPKAASFTVPEKKKSPPKKATATETPPKKSLPKVSKQLVTRNADQIARQREADLKAAADAAKAFQDTIKQTAKNLSGRLSDSVSVEVTSGAGGAGGGPSVANWAQVVHSIYDRAWIEPADATDGRATAKATITIAKDGSVVSASLTSPSGNPALDKSVRAVLDRVREVPPFPAGAREERRTVTIKFNLLAQRLPG